MFVECTLGGAVCASKSTGDGTEVKVGIFVADTNFLTVVGGVGN